MARPAASAQAAAVDEDRPLRVLAAEDIPTNQLVLRTIMQSFGVDLEMVDNGREAVEAWQRSAFDVILMDIQMPEMDGVAATRAIRAEEAASGRPRTPIIAVSANAMPHHAREYLAAGMDAHVAKPIELAKLHAAIEGALAQSAAAQPTTAQNAAQPVAANRRRLKAAPCRRRDLAPLCLKRSDRPKCPPPRRSRRQDGSHARTGPPWARATSVRAGPVLSGPDPRPWRGARLHRAADRGLHDRDSPP